MTSAGPSSGLTYARRLEPADAARWCFEPTGCVDADPVVPLVLVVVTTVTTLVVALALAHVGSARSLLEEERKRTREERDAFAEFARRLEEIEARTAEATIRAGGAMPTFSDRSPGGNMDQVKDVYRDTVMAVSHYDEEYDEPIEANMTAELGDELAAAAAEGTTLTPYLKAAFVRQTAEALSRREQFLERLDGEAADLDEAEPRLEDVETSLEALIDGSVARMNFADLRHAWHRLDTLDERCRSLLADRQESLHETPVRSGNAPSLQAYLYRSLEVEHPVLAAGTELAERIDATRRRIASAISRRA